MTDTEAIVQEVKDNAGRLGLTWQRAYATVVDGGDPTAMTVGFDADTPIPAAVDAVSLVGSLPKGTRVVVDSVPPAGQFVVGAFGGTFSLLAWGERATQSTAASAAQGVLRLDNVPVISGHKYLICTSNMLLFSTVAADVGSARIALSTSGAATTASTLSATANSPAIVSIGNGVQIGPLSFLYQATSSGALSVLLYTLRLSGTGNVSIFASTGNLTQLAVYHVDANVPDSGVSI